MRSKKESALPSDSNFRLINQILSLRIPVLFLKRTNINKRQMYGIKLTICVFKIRKMLLGCIFLETYIFTHHEGIP